MVQSALSQTSEQENILLFLKDDAMFTETSRGHCVRVNGFDLYP